VRGNGKHLHADVEKSIL